ncbi:hypothetical protein EPN81_04360 [Patescibacteria group bacterium]|nr:MAG: hypothetical protein EPN81_04360 [Patescibacteria group bacterium]
MRSPSTFVALLAFLLPGCVPSTVPAYEPGAADDDVTSDDDATAPDDDSTPPVIDIDDDGVSAQEDCDDTDASVGGPSLWYLDTDVDGYGGSNSVHGCHSDLSGGPWVDLFGDCNDLDPTIYPGAPEVCDSVDQDCDLTVDEGFDQDADDFLTCEGDCDDTDSSVFPDAKEICDAVDNDCDEQVDEEVLDTFYGDWDGDGFGDIDMPAFACTAPGGFLSDASDCDDTNFDVHPGAAEICDTIDNDCDGDIDDEDDSVDPDTMSVFYADADQDTFGAGSALSACSAPAGYVGDGTDCDDADSASHPGAPEVCDGLDNDCDETTDENLFSSWYADTDGDGYGSGSVISVICGGSTGSLVDNATDCNDGEANANPAAVEVCDAIDNDCDGIVDEIEGNPDVQTLWDDDDGDGWGDEEVGSFQSCPANGFVLQGGDCDDTNPGANPSQTEVGLDAIDNDCDGIVDEGGIYCCLDIDADGFGDGDSCVYQATGACDPGSVEGDGDCNDANFSYHPYALDILGDGEDTDCDGSDE